jgi:hypothetical protein
MSGLFRREVLFLVSPDAAASLDQCEDELVKASPPYQKTMRARIRAAKKEGS